MREKLPFGCHRRLGAQGVHRPEKCIERYCCHEMYSSRAIRLDKDMVGRTLDRIVTGPGSGH